VQTVVLNCPKYMTKKKQKVFLVRGDGFSIRLTIKPGDAWVTVKERQPDSSYIATRHITVHPLDIKSAVDEFKSARETPEGSRNLPATGAVRQPRNGSKNDNG
jgi:hypothetical protein